MIVSSNRMKPLQETKLTENEQQVYDFVKMQKLISVHCCAKSLKMAEITMLGIINRLSKKVSSGFLRKL